MAFNHKLHLNLALQGGGAHGAFTWGVLDRLLDEPNIGIEAISGTSAGAMNALMVAQGWQDNGPHGARERLKAFWESIAAASPLGWLDAGGPPLVAELAGRALNEIVLQWASQPAGYLRQGEANPLRELVEAQVDFARLRRDCPIKLFIAATEVRSGKMRLFREQELDGDRVLASACLPHLFHAVEVEGDYYWDGGFSANPAIFPLLFECRHRDLMIIQVQPLVQQEVPRGGRDVTDRVAEMSFNSTFLREMRALAYTRERLRGRRWLLGPLERRLRNRRFHLIESGEDLARLPRASRYDTRLSFLEELRDKGRERAARWLARHGSDLGRRSSLNLQAVYG